MKKPTFLFVFLFITAFVSAQSYFVKIDNFDGPLNTPAGETGYSRMISFNQAFNSIVQEATVSDVEYLTPRYFRPQEKTLTLVKKMDEASMGIMDQWLKEEPFQEVSIEIFNAQNQIVCRYVLSSVSIVSFLTKGKNEGFFPLEEITIGFESQEVEYFSYNNRGGPTGSAIYRFD